MELRFSLLLAALFFGAPAAAAQLTLAWTDTSNNEGGFRIERRTSGGSFAQIAQVSANVTSFVDSSVTAGTTYCYRVRGYNQQSVSAYTNEVCGAPTSPSAQAVTISASPATATEGGAAGQFVVRRTGSTAAALTVNLTVGGTATAGDYATLPTTVVIPAGASSAAITVRPTDDTAVEPNETVVVTLKAGTGYTVGASSSATVSVVDNDAAITIDNGGTGTSFTGTWLVSGAPNPYGSASLYASGSGQDTYRWTPTIPTMRAYDVYAWWTAHPNRSTNVQYRIVSAGGTAVLTRDQRTGGGRWQSLGTFQFNAGTAGYVQVSDVNGGIVSADAIRWEPAGMRPPLSQIPPGGIVIDNGGTATRFTGTWLVSGVPNPYGSTSLYASGSGEDTYRWTPTIPTMRAYDVYARWTAHPNRSTNVQYRIVSAGGTAVITRNQRTGGGQWQYLGTFQFNAGTGGYVQVSDSSGSIVSADAVLFAPR